MNELIMMIGIPSSGKSTVANRISKDIGAIVHSSDNLRKELYGSYSIFDKNNELFEELHKRIINDLKDGKSVVYDATNLSMKKRKHFLTLIPKNIHKKAVVVATTINDCLIRDGFRNKKVGSKVIIDMWKRFQFPLEQEGFDEIIIEYNSKFDYMVRHKNISDACDNFEQDNPHHSMKLGEHMRKSFIEYSYENSHELNSNILRALLVHDIGKLWTKTFKNKKGIISDVAHYYEHNNIGSYEAMFIFPKIAINYDTIKIFQLIQYHMQPYFMTTEKSIKKWTKFFGEDFHNELLIMNKYDRLAH